MVTLGPGRTGTDETCQVADQCREREAAEPVVFPVDCPNLTNLGERAREREGNIHIY